MVAIRARYGAYWYAVLAVVIAYMERNRTAGLRLGGGLRQRQRPVHQQRTAIRGDDWNRYPGRQRQWLVTATPQTLVPVAVEVLVEEQLAGAV